jgi:FMN phosphatase YigB (HAD superfamily)
MAEMVFLFDVDNTLLDNDRVVLDLRRYLTREVGEGRANEYFEIFEALRNELGYSDYLGALQRYRHAHPRDPNLLAASSYLLNYLFKRRLYPGALDALAHAARFGPTVILSDGDVVFQPRKVKRSGLWQAVEGRVLIYVHKELELEDVERRYPAAHYVMVDDKVRILTAVKEVWRARVTTVFPRQGHYAFASDVATYPKPDVTIDRIGALIDFDGPALRAAAVQRSVAE